MASLTLNLTADTSGWDFARRQRRLYRFSAQLRWALQDAGYSEARLYPLPAQRAGFLLTEITPDPVPGYCTCAHLAEPGTDCRPFVAQYHAALETAGFRCEWEPVFPLQNGQYARFRVYPPDEADQ